jgi:hypothetical protein
MLAVERPHDLTKIQRHRWDWHPSGRQRRTVMKGTSDEFDRPCRIWESLPKAAGTAVSLNLKRKNLDRTIHHTQTQTQPSGAGGALSVL